MRCLTGNHVSGVGADISGESRHLKYKRCIYMLLAAAPAAFFIHADFLHC